MRCPRCGTPNREGDPDLPATVDELHALCRRRGIHPHALHFYFSPEHHEPKAHGLYRGEDGQFVVYKNLLNGERETLYRGESESEAVRQLYGSLCRKLCREEHRSPSPQPEENARRSKRERRRRRKRFLFNAVFALLALALLVGLYLALTV